MMNRASKPVYTNIGVRGNGFLLLTLANYLSLKRKNPVNETTMLKTAIIPIQLVALVSFKLFQLPNIRLKDSKLNAMLDKTVIGKTTIEPTATITNIFCLSFIAKFNQ